MQILCFSILLMLILISGCIGESTVKSDVTPMPLTCCSECESAANRDPSGFDISVKACNEYNLSTACKDYFVRNPRRVGECG